MESLKELPEAKNVIDDLMERTFNAEKNLEDHKKKNIEIIKHLIKNISILQIHLSGVFGLDKDNIENKQELVKHLIHLLEINLN
tara:strand:+ start:131 stop:382 length:252 start_codon:yes stop_codon:yes gene_type:complete